MAGKPKYDWPEDDALVALVREHGTIKDAAAAFGVPAMTFRYQLEQRGLVDRVDAARVDYAGDGTAGRTIEGADPLELGDAEALMRKHGLKPEQWKIRNPVRLNTWGGQDGGDNAQVRIDLDQRTDLLLPARSDGWKAPKRAKVDRSQPFMFVAVGDRHCPLHDEGLHAAMCTWLREFEPELFIDVGDLMDLANASRFRENPARTQHEQACVQTAYSVKRGEIEASPNTVQVMVPGNHDWRLRNIKLDKNVPYGIRRADNPDFPQEEWPAESLPHLLRFDELGVTFVGGDDDYDQYEYEIAPGLVALHGYKSRPHAGQSVHSLIDAYAMSGVVGHVHRQAITTLTKPDDDRGPREWHGMEVGAAYQRGDSLNYGHRGGNNQHGFGTGIVWPDGRHLFELARWDGRSLVWRNWRCTP